MREEVFVVKKKRSKREISGSLMRKKVDFEIRLKVGLRLYAGLCSPGRVVIDSPNLLMNE